MRGDGRYRGVSRESRKTPSPSGNRNPSRRVAGGAGSFFAPKSAGSLRRRVALYKLLTRGPLAKVLDKLATQAATAIKLKDYPEPARAA